MARSKKIKGGGQCNTIPNLSVYNAPCSGLPLDSQFQNYVMDNGANQNLQSGGGYFFDIGNPNPINPMDAPVQGYSECCHPLFNTSVGSTNAVNANTPTTANASSTLFNASGYAVGSAGNPICGGGKKNSDGKRKTKNNKAKNTRARGYSAKKTIRLEEIHRRVLEHTSNSPKSKKGSKKGKKGQKGGQNSVFSGNMMNRNFNCSQPQWNASCI